MGAESEYLQIESVKFCNMVVNREPTSPIPPDQQIEGNRVFCWVNLRGGAEAYRLLQKEGRLPLRHEWKLTEPRLGFSSPVAPNATDQDTLSTTQTIGIGTVPFEKILKEYESAGCFDWRTWSYVKNSLQANVRLTVRLLDRQNRAFSDSEGRQEFAIHYLSK